MSGKLISSAAKSLTVRTVSYNVLSSHLALPEQYPTMDPSDLDAGNRLPIVLDKLESEMMACTGNGNGNGNSTTSNSHEKVIFCLQEVSYDWASSLHKFFANKGYHLITGLYGRKFNGYMGVAVAFPLQHFEVVDVDVSRLSDTRTQGWPKHPKAQPPRLKSVVEPCLDLLKAVKNMWYLPYKAIKHNVFNIPKAKPPIDHWSYSEDRKNVLVSATLKDKDSGIEFVVGNYHMPCAFYAPMVMTIHCEMAAKHVQRMASKPFQRPYILAGDWNLKPHDDTYKLLTTGQMSKSNSVLAYPQPPKPIPKGHKFSYTDEEKNEELMKQFIQAGSWVPSIDPMRSAYAAYNKQQKQEQIRAEEEAEAARQGVDNSILADDDDDEDDCGEPDFTNYAATRTPTPPDDTFIDTLDYIFISPEWGINSVKHIPNRKEVDGPLPNLKIEEPSDHVLIAATLQIDQDQ